jgi:ribosomal protein L31E
MKTPLKIILVLFCLTLVNCGSASDYTKNTLNQQFFKGKTIKFILDNTGVNTISFEGPKMGFIVQPNFKDVFRESIEELAQETKLNLRFIENRNEISDSEIIVEAKITQALWSFGFSKATMKTTVTYKVKSTNDKTYQINGIRKSGGGAENNNLRKSLKNANYNFLKELEK